MKVLVVDDEKPARERLKQLLDDIEHCEVVGEAGNGNEALEQVSQLQPAVVLLDIRMPGMDGIETAHHLNQLDNPPAVVFTTAYDQYAIDAFDARAVGYVLKPVRRSRLERALEQAARLSPTELDAIAEAGKLDNRRQHVCSRHQDELRLIPLDTITCFIAEQKYVTVCHDGGEDLVDDSLKSLEQEFADDFVRIHRSALVRMDRIDRLEKRADGKTRVQLRAGSQVGANPLIISRRHVADVRRRLKGE